MNPSIEDRFHALCQLPEAEWTALLEGIRATEPDLAAELHQLLRAHGRAAAPLDGPPDLAALGVGRDDLMPPKGFDLQVGDRLGEFVLEAAIGQGAMGRVFAARQSRPDRRVALKVLQLPAASQAGQRFRMEADVLARLDHPNIAKVFDAGVSPLPGSATGESDSAEAAWMALELIVDARPLVEYADAAGLSVVQRIRLLVDVCRGVDHAHCKGVIHRDLKPANVLVGSDGVPHIIDFGVSRLREGLTNSQLVQTRAGELCGTLRYMSPEQSLGDPRAVDRRTDVHALGLMLWELVLGSLPYDLDDCSLVQALDRIRAGRIPNPATVRPDLHADLCAILRRATARDPELRYAHADGLADDLQRYLEHRPVQAREPSGWHRLRLFARRNPRWTRATALAAAVLACCVGVMAWMWERQRLAEDDAISARTALRELRAWFDAAEADSPELAGRLAAGALADLEAAAGPEERRRIIAARIRKVEELEPLLATDTQGSAMLAEVYGAIGRLLGNEWQAGAADAAPGLAAHRHAVALWRQVLAERPDDRAVQARLVTELVHVVEGLRKTEAGNAGLALADEALERSKALRAEDPDDPAWADLRIGVLWAAGDLRIPMESANAVRLATQWSAESIALARRFVDRLGTARWLDREAWGAMRLAMWTLRSDQVGGLRLLREATEARLRAFQKDSRSTYYGGQLLGSLRQELHYMDWGSAGAPAKDELCSHAVAVLKRVAPHMSDARLGHWIASELHTVAVLIEHCDDPVQVAECRRIAQAHLDLALQQPGGIAFDRVLAAEALLSGHWNLGPAGERFLADVEAELERAAPQDPYRQSVLTTLRAR